MKRIILFIAYAVFGNIVNAQVGIGTQNPKATLEVVGANTPESIDGILIPRISRDKAKNMVGMENATLVFVNSIDGTHPNFPNDGPASNPSIASQVDAMGFYYYQASSRRWMKLPDYDQVTNLISENTYWAPQGSGTRSPKTQDTNTKDTSNDVTKVYENIFQRGKVGIGYSNQLDVDFEVNTTLKQLEVGGDFRTSTFFPQTSRYYGFETNSIALPSQYATRGNVLFNAKSKNLEDYSYFDRLYDGNMMIQTDDNLFILSRTGQSNTTNGAKAYENQMSSSGNVQFLYNSTPDQNDEYTYLQTFNTSGFGVSDFNRSDVAFGLDFNKNKFYIGNNLDYGDGYFFPTKKGNSGQILKLNNNRQLEWSDLSTQTGSTSPKFFYMPSIVLPINGVNSTYVTYDSTNQSYTVDLYQAFKGQFDAPIKSSNGTATGLQGFVLPREAYEYHIIYADNTVFPHTDINFSSEAGQEGKFTYKVNPATIVNGAAFMNIVLKVK